ncbi:MAG: DUF2270 domain-containing protein [Pseudomonadota bacterium]
MDDAKSEVCEPLTGAELGAMAHLYRGEVYRSTIWRTRLDATTNWSVVSLGLALTISYQSAESSALPLFLVALLICVFLYLEARRYRYFNVWRARARWLEIHFYAPMMRRNRVEDPVWLNRLAEDYERPEHHISFARALGRRLRRNYMWIFSVQTAALYGKCLGAAGGVAGFESLHIGPFPGWVLATINGVGYLTIALYTVRGWVQDKKRRAENPNPISMG